MAKVRLDARKLPRKKVEYIIMEVPLDHPLPDPPCLNLVEVRLFKSSDLEFVRRDFLPSEAAMCARRLAAGHEGLTAFLDGEFAGCCWLCREDSLERTDLPIGADEILFTDAFTAPRFRGQGVNTSLALASLRRAKELHLRRLIGYIRTDNAASQAVWLGKMCGRVFAKLEFKRVWTGRRTRITHTCSSQALEQSKGGTGRTFYVCYYRECFRRGLDAGRMTRYLISNGWQPVTQMAKADLVIVYTCGGFDFTEKRCYKTIGRALSQKKAPPRVIVTGCLLKINPGPLERIEGIELVPPETPDRFDALLQAHVPLRQIPDANLVPENARDLDDDSLLTKFFERLEFNRHSWKILFYMIERKIRGEIESSHEFVKDVFKIKIADGCLGRCAYCALKIAGGRLRSKPLDQVLDEFRKGLKSGFRRFEFVSLDLGCYGRDIGIKVSQLLEESFRLGGDFQVILNDLNIHWLIRDGPLLPLLARFKSKIEHLRIPIQSGSDRILKRMKRPYRESEIHSVLDQLFREIPEVPIYSHFMVGFPGETDEDHEATARLIDKYPFRKIDVFCYQERPGVESAGLEGKVPHPLILKRANTLASRRRGIDISYA